MVAGSSGEWHRPGPDKPRDLNQPENMSNWNDDVMKKLMDEMRRWQEFEALRLPSSWTQEWSKCNVRNISSVQAVLKILVDLLTLAELTEDDLVVALVSGSIQSEETCLELMWWILSSRRATASTSTGIDDVLLGPQLALLLRRSSWSRKLVQAMISEKLNLLSTWAGAFANGEARVMLEEIHECLVTARWHFQCWTRQAELAKLLGRFSANNGFAMTIREIQNRMEELMRKVTAPPLPPPCRPLGRHGVERGEWNYLNSKTNECTRELCLGQSEFYLFTPYSPLHVRPQARIYGEPFILAESEKYSEEVGAMTENSGGIYEKLTRLSISDDSGCYGSTAAAEKNGSSDRCWFDSWSPLYSSTTTATTRGGGCSSRESVSPPGTPTRNALSNSDRCRYWSCSDNTSEVSTDSFPVSSSSISGQDVTNNPFGVSSRSGSSELANIAGGGGGPEVGLEDRDFCIFTNILRLARLAEKEK